MEGVIEEGSEALEEEGNENVLDLGIIGAGSRVERYEMAGYTTAISLVKQLGNNEIVSLLTQTLNEEQANLGNDKKLKNVDTNKVTGVKVGDDRKDNSSQTAPKGLDKTKE